MTEEIAETLGLDEAKGALVATVIEDGPAEQAGIRAGDVVLVTLFGIVGRRIVDRFETEEETGAVTAPGELVLRRHGEALRGVVT